MPHDRFAQAEASMRALGYHRRKRRADTNRLNEVEAGLAEVVRMAGPLPVTRVIGRGKPWARQAQMFAWSASAGRLGQVRLLRAGARRMRSYRM